MFRLYHNHMLNMICPTFRYYFNLSRWTFIYYPIDAWMRIVHLFLNNTYLFYYTFAITHCHYIYFYHNLVDKPLGVSRQFKAFCFTRGSIQIFNPLDALLAFLVTSVIEVSKPRLSSNVVPVTDNTELTFPKLFARSADDTAKLLLHFCYFPK